MPPHPPSFLSNDLIIAFLKQNVYYLLTFLTGGTETKHGISKYGRIFFLSSDLIPKLLLRNLLLLIALLLIIPSLSFAAQATGETAIAQSMSFGDLEQSLTVPTAHILADEDTDIDVDDADDRLDVIQGEEFTIDYSARILRKTRQSHNEDLHCNEAQIDKPDRAPPYFQIADEPYKHVHIFHHYPQQLQPQNFQFIFQELQHSRFVNTAKYKEEVVL